MALDPFLLQQILGQSTPVAAIPGATPPFAGATASPTPMPQPSAQPPDILQDILSGRYNPVAEPEKLTTGQKVAGGLADFVNNYLALKYGRPAPQSSLEQMRGRQEDVASRKTQGNLARVQAQIQERQRKATEAKEAGETARAERRLQIDEQEAKARAKEIADGKVATQEELAAALLAYDVETDTLDLSNVADRARARGLIMRAKMDQERADRLELKNAGKAEETASDRMADRKMKAEFLAQIEDLEADLAALPQIPDPEEARKSFIRKVRRRFSPADAGELIQQFEQVVGPAIDAEMEKRKAKPQAAAAANPLAGAALPVRLGGAALQDIQTGIPDLLQLLGSARTPQRY